MQWPAHAIINSPSPSPSPAITNHLQSPYRYPKAQCANIYHHSSFITSHSDILNDGFYEQKQCLSCIFHEELTNDMTITLLYVDRYVHTPHCVRIVVRVHDCVRAPHTRPVVPRYAVTAFAVVWWHTMGNWWVWDAKTQRWQWGTLVEKTYNLVLDEDDDQSRPTCSLFGTLRKA